MYYKNPNPTDVRSSSHARVLFFLPAVAFLVHAFLHVCMLCFPPAVTSSFCMLSFPMIILLSTLAYCQQAPNTDMWLVPSHLILLSFLDLLGDRLELFLKLCLLLSVPAVFSLMVSTTWAATSSLINSAHSAWVCAICVLSPSACVSTSATHSCNGSI
jgi:hypothetical protein